MKCPACGNLGALAGDPEPEWEADYDKEGLTGVYVKQIALSANEFECAACGLVLTRDLLAQAGLDRWFFTDEDFDLSDATDYFNRIEGEDAWADMHDEGAYDGAHGDESSYYSEDYRDAAREAALDP
jgi:hypothetical protein